MRNARDEIANNVLTDAQCGLLWAAYIPSSPLHLVRSLVPVRREPLP